MAASVFWWEEAEVRLAASETASETKGLYCSCFEAARISDGLVVESCGWNCLIPSHHHVLSSYHHITISFIHWSL
jgi:hypothetical protein